MHNEVHKLVANDLQSALLQPTLTEPMSQYTSKNSSFVWAHTGADKASEATCSKLTLCMAMAYSKRARASV